MIRPLKSRATPYSLLSSYSREVAKNAERLKSDGGISSGPYQAKSPTERAATARAAVSAE